MSEQITTGKTKKRFWLRKLLILGLSLQIGLFSQLLTIQVALAAPTITSIDHNGGPITGLQTVTITGTNFMQDAYYRPYTITNSSGTALSNVQFDLVVDTSTPISGSKMASNCSDLRFVDSTETNLYYWIESDAANCNSNAQHIWVKVPSVPTGTSTITMLYGSGINYASTYNSGVNTFDFFDDFSSNTVGSKWLINNGSWPLATVGDTNTYISGGLAYLNSISWGAMMAASGGTMMTFARSATMGYISKMRFYTATGLGSYTGGIVYHKPTGSGDVNYNTNSYQGFYGASSGWEKIRNTLGADYPTSGTCSAPCPAVSTYYKNMLTVADTTANNEIATIYRDTGNSTISTYTCPYGTSGATCDQINSKTFGMDNYVSGTAGSWMYADWFFVAKKPVSTVSIGAGAEYIMTPVSFGGTSATNVDVTSTTTLVATVPAHAAGLVNVIVYDQFHGTNSGTNNIYTYYSSIAISGVSPATGPTAGGITMTVTGTFYTGVAYTISIGTAQYAQCTATYVDASHLSCTTPSSLEGSGLKNVYVGDGNYQSNILTGVYTLYDAPTIATASNSPRPILPYFGLPAGGGSITITGTNFYSPETVPIYNSAMSGIIDYCTNVTPVSTTTITCNLPAISEQIVSIGVTTNSGTVIAQNDYYYTSYSLPAVSSNINAYNIGVTRVYGNGTALTSAATLTPQSLGHTGTPPSLPYANPFYTRYYSGAGQSSTPSFTGYGTYTNGVTITNAATYTGYISAWIDYNRDGDFADAGEQILSPGGLTAAGANANATFTLPGVTAGTTRLRVCGSYNSSTCTSTGSGSSSETYSEYEDYDITLVAAAAPTVTSIVPNKGSTAGTSVTITGTGFQTGASVYFGLVGNNPATSVNVVNGTTITATSPTSLTSGTTYAVRVQNTDGQVGSLLSAFTPYDAPTITSVLPYFGLTGVLTSLTITGTNFYDNSITTAAAQVNGVSCARSSMSLTSYACQITPSSIANGYAGIAPVAVSVTTASGTTTLSPSFSSSAYTLPTDSQPSLDIGIGRVYLPGESPTALDSGITLAPPHIYPSGTPPSLPNSSTIGAYYTNFANYFSGNSIPNLKRYNSYPLRVVGGVGGGPPNNYYQTMSAWLDYNRDFDFLDTNEAAVYNIAVGVTDPPVSPTATITIPYNASLGQTRMRVCVGNSTCNTSGNGPNVYGETEDYLVNIVAADAPTVSSVAPLNGPAADSSNTYSITITGTGFQTGAVVNMDGTIVSNVTVVNNTTITATAPNLVAGSHSIQVQNSDGQNGSKSSAYTAWAAPIISSLSATNGPVSNSITITGTNFYDGSFTAYGNNCTRTSMPTSTSMVCTTPTSPGSVNISVTTPTATTATYTYTGWAAPTISSVSPDNGKPSGGETLTITGTNFYDGAATAGVTIGGTNCNRSTPFNSTTFTCIAPVKTASAYTLTLTTSSGSASTTYTYYAAPTITSVIPPNGKSSTVTQITVTGTNIYEYAPADGYTYVTIGSNACTRVSVTEPTTFVCNTPSRAAGSYTLTLGTPSGNATSTYTYYDAPTITGVLPWAGTTAGGNSITISGTNLYTNTITPTTVTVGGSSCNITNVTAPSSITCTTPTSITGGAKNIVITTASGTVTSLGAFTYFASPTVSSISPSAGPLTGTQVVTLTGSNYYYDGVSDPSITIGGTGCTGITILTNSSLTCTRQAGTAGAKNVVYTNQSGEAGTLTSGYSYYDVPSISNVSPNVGSSAGGTSVTVTGTNFYDGTSNAYVTVGGNTCTRTGMTTQPPGTGGATFTCTTPSGTAGQQTLTLYTQSGSASRTFTYYDAPTISSLTPSKGWINGGTIVDVSGTNFYDGASNAYVTIGGTSNYCTRYSITTTHYQCYIPANSAGNQTLTITTPSGSATSTFTYYDAPSISSVVPNKGSSAGGTSIVITGTNFYDGITNSYVNLGASLCTRTGINSLAPGVAGATYTCTTPSGSGSSILTYYTNSGSATAAYTYFDAPTITSIVPNASKSGQTQSVTITGTNFYDGTVAASVEVGGTANACTSPVLTGTTQIVCTMPSRSAGAVNVRVNTSSGYSSYYAYNYYDAPTITSVIPGAGPLAGGTTITVTGTNFYDGSISASVTIGGNTCTRTGMSPQPPGTGGATFTCTTPASAAGSSTLRLNTGSGTAASTFSYYDTPSISSIWPTKGPSAGGNMITVTGTNFYDGASNAYVTIGGTTCPRTGLSSQPPGTGGATFTCTAPAKTASGYTLAIYTPSGSATTTYTYYDPPTISSVVPNSGSSSGGTTITVNGSNFYDGAGNAYVAIGGTTCSPRTGMTDTTITCVTPTKTAGGYTLTVFTQSGSANSTYTYYDAPTITSIVPNASKSSQTKSVTITGTGFYNGAANASVEVAGVSNACTSPVLTGSTQIVCTMPALTAGAKNVRVNTSSGYSGYYTYTYYDAPTVTSISPTKGPVAGGDAVIIYGTNFYYDGVTTPTVTTDGSTTFCNSVSVISSTEIHCITVSGTAGTTVNLVVTTPSGQSSPLTSAYKYFAAPTVTSITPNKGPSAGGQSVTIGGTNFYDGNTLLTATIGGTSSYCTIANRSTDITTTSILCTTPAGTSGTAKDVTVITGSGSNTSSGAYTYFDLPTITSIVPNAGPTGTANPITINGTGFYDIIPSPMASVTVGGQTCTSPTVVSTTQMTCTTPAFAGSPGAKNVIITTGSGSSSASTYTFYNAPTFSNTDTLRAVVPYYGPRGSGNVITINGTNFYTTTQYPIYVTVDGYSCSSVYNVTANSLNCAVPAPTPAIEKPVSVAVTTGSGTVSLSNAYYYNNYTLPMVTTPCCGIGTSRVTLRGETYTNLGIDNTTVTPTSLSHSGTPPSLPYQTAFFTNFDPVQNRSGTDLSLGVPTLEKYGRYFISIYKTYSANEKVSVWIDFNQNGSFGDSGELLFSNQIIGATNNYLGQIDIPSSATSGYTRMRIATEFNSYTIPSGGNGPNTYGEYEDYTVNIVNSTAPTVTNFSPNKGPAAAGYNFTVTGTSFKPGANIYFGALGSNAATSVTWVNSTTLTAQTPALTSGTTYTVYVRNLDFQSASLAGAYTAYGPPTVTYEANSWWGSPAGGSWPAFSGTNFYSNSVTPISVTVDGNPCAPVTINSTTGLNCYIPASVPPSTEKIVNYSITTASGTATITNGFYYSPYSLARVSLPGNNIGIQKVYLAGDASPVQILNNWPLASCGANCNLTPPSLTSVSDPPSMAPPGTLYYTNFAPKQVANNTPPQTNWGTPHLTRNHSYSFSIHGASTTDSQKTAEKYSLWIDFNNNKTFNDSGENLVNNASLPILASGNDVTTSITIPVSAAVGITRMRVGADASANPDITAGSSNSGEFEDYQVEIGAEPTPVVTSVTSPKGPPSPLTSNVTISGSNFDTGAQVKFGTTYATGVTVLNSTTITATTPALAIGTYDVAVEQPDGTSGSLTGGFQVVGAPNVVTISPNEVPVSTSNSATIVGSNFYTNSQYPLSASIGGSPCTGVSVTDQNTLTCNYPSKTAGAYSVSVTTGSGTGSANNLITYYGAPTVTGVNPAYGSSVGGTHVNITGTNFFPVGGSPTVTFGGTPATGVTVINSTTIQAITPAHAVGPVDVSVETQSGTGTRSSSFDYWPQPINANTSTLDSYSSKIEPVDPSHYNTANFNPVNEDFVKVTLYEQDYGTPAVGREVTLNAVPSDNISILGTDCSDPRHILDNPQPFTDSLGTACFRVYSSATPSFDTSTVTLSATVSQGNYEADSILAATRQLTIGNYAATSTLDYRYRNDDGNERTATPIANTNVPFYNAIANTAFRLRYGLTRNMPQGTDDLRFDEFSPTNFNSYGPGPLGDYNPADFKAFSGGYAINESNNTLYAITPYEEVTKAHVYKFNLNDLSQTPTSFEFPATVNSTPPYGDRIDAPITSTTHNVTRTFIDPDNNLMYFVLSPYFTNSPAALIRIYKVNLTTQTVVDVLAEDLPTRDDINDKSYDSEIDLANGFLYVTVSSPDQSGVTPRPRVMKIKLNGPTQAMTNVGDLLLGNTGMEITSSVIDTTNQYLYVTTGNPQKIIKIDLNVGATLPPVVADEITLAPIPTDSPNEKVGYQSAVIDSVNGYAYFGSSTDYTAPDFDGQQRAFITKVDTDPNRTFEVVSRLDLLPSNYSDDEMTDANYIYYPNYLDPVTNVFPAASIDTTNGYAYFPMSRYNQPRYLGFHKIMRIHLSDFSRQSLNDEMIYSNNGSTVIKGTVFRPSTGRGYFIHASTPGYETLTEFNSTGRQNLRLQEAKAIDNQYCNYANNNSYVWHDLPSSDFVLSDSPNFTDGDASSNVTGLLYDNNDSFVAGQLKDTSATTSLISLGENQFSEIEYSLKPTSSASGSYCFRLTDADPSHDNQVSGYPNLIYGLTGTDYSPTSYNVYAPLTVGGLILSKTSVNIIEGTTTDSYGIKLAKAPASDVTVTIHADDSRITLSPATPLTFTTANWNTYQYVTVSAANNGIVDGTTTSTIHHTVSSGDAAYNNIISPTVSSVVTDYGSTSSNVRATVSGEATFTPPSDFSFPQVSTGTASPNFSPTLNLQFSDTRGPASDYTLTVQASDFCKYPGVCLPLNKVYMATSALSNIYNTFTPAQIAAFAVNYLQNGQSLTDRSTFVHSNPGDDRQLNTPTTVFDTRNIPGNGSNPLQGDTTLHYHLMIDFGTIPVQEIGTYTTTLTFDFNTNP